LIDSGLFIVVLLAKLPPVRCWQICFHQSSWVSQVEIFAQAS